MAKKISEFTEGTDMKETDIIPYVDLENQTTKKITLKNIFKSSNTVPHRYDFQQKFDSISLDNNIITLPAYYKKGSNVLQIYFEGCLLIKGINYNEGTEENLDGEIINTIQLLEWGNITGTYNMSIIIQGEYEAPVEGTESEVNNE